MDTIQKFENEHVALDLETKPNCLVKLSITTKPLATKAAEEKAIKNVTRQVTIPGFRQGKAPKDIILKQFKGKVEKEQTDILVRNALNEALALTHRRPYSDRSPVQLLKSEPRGNDSHYIEVEFEAYPQVPSINPQELKFEKINPTQIEDKNVDERLDDLRLYHASWEEIADRGVQEEDYITLDIDVIDEKPFKAYQNSRFFFKKIPAWTQKVILGLKTGESAEGLSEGEEHKSPRQCLVTVKKIEKAILPAVDDELAKKAGVATADELMKAIRTSLENEAKLKALQETRVNLKKMLVEKFSFDLPESHLNSLREQCSDTAEQEKSRFKTDEEMKEYEDTLFNDNVENLKFSFLFPKIIQEQKLPRPDIQKLRERMMRYLLNRHQDGLKDINQEEAEYFARLAENELYAEEALDFLIDKA